MCGHSPEGKLYPGLHQKKDGQQSKGGISAPLLHSGDTSLEVVCPAQECQAQDMDLLEQARGGPQQ